MIQGASSCLEMAVPDSACMRPSLHSKPGELVALGSSSTSPIVMPASFCIETLKPTPMQPSRPLQPCSRWPRAGCRLACRSVAAYSTQHPVQSHEWSHCHLPSTWRISGPSRLGARRPVSCRPSGYGAPRARRWPGSGCSYRCRKSLVSFPALTPASRTACSLAEASERLN
jgi:hypothetical protein